MTKTTKVAAPRERSMQVRSAAAQAAIKLREYDHIPVPHWIREVAAGRDAKPPADWYEA